MAVAARVSLLSARLKSTATSMTCRGVIGESWACHRGAIGV